MNNESENFSFTKQLGIEVPVIAGAMYPCSNPELVAAVSESGGIGIVQPISLTYVHGYDFREGLKYIKQLTSRPIGMNALIEKSSKKYHEKMVELVDIALEEGVRFFVTSLGKPGWVVKRVHEMGGFVYHDVTERKWADKGMDDNVDGLIAVNDRAGGHAGSKSMETLYDELSHYNVPLICAGGVANEVDFKSALNAGYAGVQMGTRFIATVECNASDAYKAAVVSSKENDIVLSECITGVPVAVINTPYIKRSGLKSGRLARWMLKGTTTKHLMRILYALKSLYQLKHSLHKNSGDKQYWQAGKSVDGIDKIESVATIMSRLAKSLS